MDDRLREQIYGSLILRETDDLLEIWRTNRPNEWQPEVFEILAEILQERLGFVPARSGRVQADQALDPEQAFLPGDEDDLARAEQALDRAEAFLQTGENDRALAECETAVQMAPKFANAYNSRGVAYDALGDLKKALADYQMAAQLDPTLTDALENIESAERELEQDFERSSAKEHLDQALEYSYSDTPELAAPECELARASLPAIAPAYNYLGLILQELGQLEPAIRAYREAMRLNPRFRASRTNLRNARLSLEAEQFRLDARQTWDGSQDELDEWLAEHQSSEPYDPSEYDSPAPAWLYLDERAFVLPGYSGHRTLPGRSGYDPLESDFELARMEGVMLRRLVNRRFRTHNPVYLLLMVCLGIVFCSLLALATAGFPTGALASTLYFVLYCPYWIAGLALFVNVGLSLTGSKTVEAEENGYAFF